MERERATSLKAEHPPDEREEYYLWLDVISLDEHRASEFAKGFSTTFMEAINKIGHIYLIAEPWDEPVVLTRIWCLWEVYCCAQAKAVLTICVSEESEEPFMECGETGDNPAGWSVKSSRAQASCAEDLEKIQYQIEQQIDGGFEGLDSLVEEQWEDAIFEVMQHVLGS